MSNSGNGEPGPSGALLVAWLVFLFFGTIGTWFICFEIKAFHGAEQSKSWAQTTGQLRVLVGEYRRDVSYSYSVKDQSYSSDRVIFGEFWNRTPSKEWRWFANMPDGSEVKVYYMPGKPWESTLIKGRVVTDSFGTLIAGVGLILFGFFGFVVGVLVKRGVIRPTR